MSKDLHAVAGSLIGLIKEVKPSVADIDIRLEDSLTETLGLDSLDVLQLLRKARRVINSKFDQTEWLSNATTHRCTVQSLADALRGETVA
jgi:acyl carrier protein